jgi:putative transposase
MPWSNTMQQRKLFIDDLKAGIYSFTEICERYGISRTTGYKWEERYEQAGVEGLRDRSRRPHGCSHQTDPEVAEAILDLRRDHPRWGPKKLLAVLEADFAVDVLPAISTCADLLKRNGLVSSRPRRRSHPPARRPVTQAARPNHVWTIDFKGEFLMRNARYCYPLTVCDDFSRFIVAIAGMHAIHSTTVRRVLERLFREYGLPEVMLSDNGCPFASNGLGRLSRLSVWWMRLGIRLERSRPSTPTDNARHERMHRELKADCTRPPERNLKRQQSRFDTFRPMFNELRPHEAHGQKTPASLYAPAPRPFPETLPEPRYPGHYRVTRVNNAGTIRLKDKLLFLTTALAGQHVGWHEIDDGIWSIEFAGSELGRYDQRRHKFHPGGAMGPKAANKKTGANDDGQAQ